MRAAPALRLPALWFLAAAAAQRGVGAVGPVRRRAWSSAAGALIAVAGAGIAAGAVRELHRAGTTVDPRDPRRSEAVVDSGVFACSRHPIYLGLALGLTGHALHLRRLLPLVPLVAFVAAADRQARLEERALAEAFGPRYAAYRARVRRWV